MFLKNPLNVKFVRKKIVYGKMYLIVDDKKIKFKDQHLAVN